MTIFENNGYHKSFFDLFIKNYFDKGSSTDSFRKGTYLHLSFYLKKVTETEDLLS